MKTWLGIILCGSLALQAQTWEVHAFALSQKASAAGNFPQMTYNRRGISFVRDAPRNTGDALLQYAFAFAPGPSEDATYHSGSTSPFGGVSGRYSPGGFVSAGFNFQNSGAFRVGIGLEFRMSAQHREGSSGDTGGGETSFKFSPWANAHIRYAPVRAGLAPVVGIQYGVSSVEAPAPNKEFGFFAGLRF